jgi:ribosome recycling factor
MLEDLKKDARERMTKCVQTFQADLKKLRTGRAHPSLVEHLKVDYYGNETPLNQVANRPWCRPSKRPFTNRTSV